MAKKSRRRTNVLVKEFLAELASDPKKLGQFILNPGRYLKKRQKRYPKSIWERIFRAVAHEVLDDLLNFAAYQH